MERKISDETYAKKWGLIMTQRKYFEERERAIAQELGHLDRQAEAAGALEQIKATLSAGFDNLSNEQWRELFSVMNMEVHIPDKVPAPRIWQGPPFDGQLVEGYLWADVRFGISIVPTKDLSDIVFTRPSPPSSPPRSAGNGRRPPPGRSHRSWRCRRRSATRCPVSGPGG
jgi:hypothetical protein